MSRNGYKHSEFGPKIFRSTSNGERRTREGDRGTSCEKLFLAACSPNEVAHLGIIEVTRNIILNNFINGQPFSAVFGAKQKTSRYNSVYDSDTLPFDASTSPRTNPGGT